MKLNKTVMHNGRTDKAFRIDAAPRIQSFRIDAAPRIQSFAKKS
ncbi:hypothetical protein [Streptomyces eurythermus]